MRPKLDSRKRKIKKHLEQYVAENFARKRVAVLLSGGADSTVVALAAHHSGKKVCAFSFQVDGYPNEDFEQARHTCEVMGWEFVPVRVRKANLYKRFCDLFSVYGCTKKTEAECLFPMIDIIRAVKDHGFKEVLTGFGSFIPTNARSSIMCRKSPDLYWRSRLDTIDVGDSTATQKIIEVAAKSSVKIHMPLCHKSMVSALSGLSTSEMVGKPYSKHHYKDIYFDDFVAIGTLKGRSGSLQVKSHIQEFFSGLLDDPRLGSDAKGGDTKRRLMNVCHRLASEAKKASTTTLSAKPNVRSKFKPYTLSMVKRQSAKRLFTVVSTFAGGGGSSTGYRLAGGEIIFVNEFIDAAVKTYQLNYPDTPVISDDIRKINRSKDDVLKLFEKHGMRKGELDILDGSPPCATFSLSSAGRGSAKMTKKNVIYSDTRQSRIGYLIHDFVFMANVMQPRICIIENVTGIAKSAVFHDAMDRLRKWGYLVSYKKIVSSDYGVPQRRERLFTICVRGDIAQKVKIRNEGELACIFPEANSRPITIREALSGIKIDPQERDLMLAEARKSSLYEIMKKLPFNPKKHMRISDIDRNWKSDFNLTRLCWDLPAPTITAVGAQGRGGLCHPMENRLLTIAELKRLTGLPDDFALSGTFFQKCERLGRMVPSPVTKAIAESVYIQILSKVR